MFHAPTTTIPERKQLLRAVMSEVVVTVLADTRIADLKIIWQGGAATGLAMPMNKTGARLTKVTSEDVIDAGAIKAVDGQSGRTETWPPSAAGRGFDQSDRRRSDAIFFTADGKVVPR